MRKSKFLISIIIPTFNSENTIDICLNSIVNQNFKDFEVVIVDGLSTDATIDKVNEFSNKIENLKVVSENDKGIYDAMNKGIKLSSGEWLYFMGSDDSFYNSNVLYHISKLDELKDNDVIYGNVASPVFNGTYDGEFDYTKIENGNICHQSIFFNKSVFKKIGLFSLKYPILSDWHHNIKWFFSNQVSHQYVDIIIANYGDSGISSTQEDLEFQKDKYRLLFKYGYKKLSYSKLIQYLNAILDDNSNKYNEYYFKFIRFVLRQMRRNKIYLYKGNAI